MSRKALAAKKAEFERQIAENSGSDYWWNMAGAAMQVQIEVIDAILAED
jgi:hypothetical protein